LAWLIRMNAVAKNFLPVLANMLLAPALAHACAVCLTGAGDDPVTDAFNWSVLFLMAAPYTVVGVIAGWLVYAKRRSTANVKTESAGQPLTSLAMIQKESGR
jgi:alpha-beta hydrolase superfamily lysophospholipase